MGIEIVEAPYDMGLYGVEVGGGPLRTAACGIAAELGLQRTRIDVGSSSTHEEVNGAIEREVRGIRLGGGVALVLAGNCNSCLGTVAAVAAEAPPGIVWFDAHGDFNTPETSVTGRLEGMALAIASERFVPAERILLAGVRDLDPLEAERIAASPMQMIASAQLDAVNLPDRPLYLHIDLDVLNPAISPGANFQGSGGLELRDLEAAVGMVLNTGRVAAVGIANYNPSRDPEGRTLHIVCGLIRQISAGISKPKLRTVGDSR
jgi:arginase